MKVYSPSDIASLLKVKESTLRKYSLLLENEGYSFQRNSQNQRWYSDNDVIALRKLVTLKNNGDMNLKECASAVYLWLKGDSVTQSLTVADNATERYADDITELRELIYKQTEMIGHLSNQIDKKKNYIDDRLNKHDEILMKSLRESLETKKLIAAKENKSFLKRLFNK